MFRITFFLNSLFLCLQIHTFLIFINTKSRDIKCLNLNNGHTVSNGSIGLLKTKASECLQSRVKFTFLQFYDDIISAKITTVFSSATSINKQPQVIPPPPIKNKLFQYVIIFSHQKVNQH